MKPTSENAYSPLEEKWNVSTHLIGLCLSVIATIFLILRAIELESTLRMVSFTIFGISLMLLYAASTGYHSSPQGKRRQRMKVLDHMAIYVLIAGSYTPFALVTIQGTLGWVILGLAWGFACIGMVLKLFYTGRYKVLSTLMYVAMGWLVVFAFKTFLKNMSTEGAYWVFAGGLSYMIGALFYSIKRIPFNHALFHVWVLAGSFCHFTTVYFYV